MINGENAGVLVKVRRNIPKYKLTILDRQVKDKKLQQPFLYCNACVEYKETACIECGRKVSMIK